MTKKLDPEVKETRRRYRALAKLGKEIGVSPWLLLELQKEALELRKELGEEEAMRVLLGQWP